MRIEQQIVGDSAPPNQLLVGASLELMAVYVRKVLRIGLVAANTPRTATRRESPPLARDATAGTVARPGTRAFWYKFPTLSTKTLDQNFSAALPPAHIGPPRSR